jgi:hypothetical protein
VADAELVVDELVEVLLLEDEVVLLDDVIVLLEDEVVLLEVEVVPGRSRSQYYSIRKLGCARIGW